MYGVLMIDIDSTALTAEDVSFITQPQVRGATLCARNVRDRAEVGGLCGGMRQHNADLLIGYFQLPVNMR